jgi:hypothetical protein
MTVLDKEVDVCKFLRKRERPDNKNNLYIKNIPKLSKEDIEKKLRTTFTKNGGEIKSLVVGF